MSQGMKTPKSSLPLPANFIVILWLIYDRSAAETAICCWDHFLAHCGFYEDRGALRGTPGSANLQPEPNATELPSSAPGRLKLVELQASAPSPTPTRAEEHIATTPECRPRAPAPSPTPTRAEHLARLQIMRLRDLARRRAPKRTSHFTCWCERGTLYVKLSERSKLGCPQPRCCRCR